MPLFERWLPRHAGCLRWLVVLLLHAVVLRRSEPKMVWGRPAFLLLNKLAGSTSSFSMEVREGSLLLFLVAGGRRGGGCEDGVERLLVRSQAERIPSGPVSSVLEVDFQAAVPEIAFEDGSNQQRWFIRSYAAHCGGRRAAFPGGDAAHCVGRLAVFSPLLPLVEWRPSLFLPAVVPDGRQLVFFFASSMVFSRGGIVIPSGAVPGGGDVALAREKTWT